MRVLLAGASGHFGRLIAERLVADAPGGELAVASRSLERARSLAATLASAGSAVEVTGRVLDVGSLASCRLAVGDSSLCIDSAGPFQSRDASLVRACAESGCDYLDLSDDVDYADRVAEAGASAPIRVFTCHSTFSATVLLLTQRLVARWDVPRRVRVGLVMATRGGAGHAALAALLTTLDRTRTWRKSGFALTFPCPIGRRALWRYPTPNERWLHELYGVSECATGIGFANRAIAPTLALLSRLGIRLSGVAGALRLGRALMDWWPRSRMLGCLQLEAEWPDRRETISLLARERATDVPCFPAILTGLAYLGGAVPPISGGVRWLHEWLPWSDWERVCRNAKVEMSQA